MLLTYCFVLDYDAQILIVYFLQLERVLMSFERCVFFTGVKPEQPLSDEDNRPPPNWPSQGSIQFENYSTKDRKGIRYVLKDISLGVNPKEKIGVVGRTGAGKSSIILSLLRILKPYQGRILIDDVDITKIGLYHLRKALTIYPTGLLSIYRNSERES
eukprot:TRINITY_DN3158_c0_g2_i1.p2 TRINITY_DN3158_c0_g2~~TRINITY_DN3158_c0_g2_i1.p2  ORF type:complete len:158 (+),score=21.83 TRINITY_DN3158_c0_g2_i1:668-1141(+)